MLLAVQDSLHCFLETRQPPTPCLVVDTDVVAARASELAAAFPGARIRYAVKANPAPPVVDALAAWELQKVTTPGDPWRPLED